MSSDASTGGLIALLATLIWMTVAIGAWALLGWGLSRVFPSFGADSWRGWVPIVNLAEILRIGGHARWNVAFFFFPVVNIYGLYLYIVSTHRMNERLGRGAGMTVLAVLLPPVWALMLGFGPQRQLEPEPQTLARALEPVAGLHTSGTGLEQPIVGYAGAAEAPAPAPAPHVTRAMPPAPVIPPAGASSNPPPPFTAPLAATVASQLAPLSEPVVDAEPDVIAEPAGPVAAPAPVTPAVIAPPAPPVAPPAPAALVDAPPMPPVAPPAPAALADAPPVPPAPAEPRTPGTPGASVPPEAEPVVVHNPWAPRSDAPATPPPAPVIEITAPPVVAAPPVAVPPALAAAPPAPAPVPAPAPSPHLVEAAPPATPFVSDDEEDFETVVVDRTPKIHWKLAVDGGFELALTEAQVLLGRAPASSAPGIQALAVPDSTRTLSKVHARLDLRDSAWTITDLNATNGVLIVEADGTERLIEPGVPTAASGRFILGQVGMTIRFESPAS